MIGEDSAMLGRFFAGLHSGREGLLSIRAIITHKRDPVLCDYAVHRQGRATGQRRQSPAGAEDVEFSADERTVLRVWMEHNGNTRVEGSRTFRQRKSSPS